MTQAKADFLVIGGGIIGVTLALEAKRRFPDAAVALIEKEDAFGEHASGRNSGVLHAGFYYGADSLKARFTREGNRRLTEYCLERDLPINRCGKLVVTKGPDELASLDELLRRGRINGVDVQEVSSEDAREIEPRAKTCERALYSPSTASVDPRRVLDALLDDARTCGIGLFPSTAYLGPRDGGVRTSRGDWSVGYIINAAGLYADRVAKDFGFAQTYAIIPFKGLYLYSDEPVGALKTNIYPVPDLRNPFLGVHFTLTASGKMKIGPTAIPAFWREHYHGLKNFNLRELGEVLLQEAGLLLRDDFGFRGLAVEELSKYFKRRMVRLAGEMASGVEPKHYRTWGAPGIRAQLFDTRERKLEMDFRFEGDDRSFHVLNAVSPAFTCSMPFAEYLFDQIVAMTGASASRLR
ncbi:NAD(P)/FAD-dependent oxidoreductase [Thiocapsa roseopersicina]|uniref:L-2-hydroxyglutarate oxidase LhgO n=1 Tax=Thiocapsa roseopersicina TaxID=1058 RepID=A0A1H2Y4Z7_THIRO|nr:FAD-dependent oxidoreductase [Thiocapsa roseopersicina]SDX00283.1 L-2-hydroxyglutarate oxidase LhgO [Thiocapsa roseopersicina]